MKNERNQQSTHTRQPVSNKPRPENKDDMDSRSQKEENYTDKNNKEGKKPNSRDKNTAGN